MKLHGNARLSPKGRLLLCRRVLEQGWSLAAAALAAGYQHNGAPGERAVYHSGYYGAFVLDPDGHNIEVVNHNRD